jgi:hypothetical protein
MFTSINKPDPLNEIGVSIFDSRAVEQSVREFLQREFPDLSIEEIVCRCRDDLEATALGYVACLKVELDESPSNWKSKIVDKYTEVPSVTKAQLCDYFKHLGGQGASRSASKLKGGGMAGTSM